MASGAPQRDIVLDLGNVVSKLGFVGEGSPRHMTRNALISRPCPSIDGLSLLLSSTFISLLLSPPAGKRVVVVEDMTESSAVRHAVVAALLLNLKVSSVLLVQAPIAAALASGARGGAALVVHVGWSRTCVLPVIGDAVLVPSLQCAGYGVDRVHKALEVLEGQGKVVWEPTRQDGGGQEGRDDVIAVACFVRGDVGDQPPPTHGDASFSLPSGQRVAITAEARWGACEGLFADGARDDDEASVAELLLECLMRCSVDSRAQLASNIVLSGGGCMLPGFGSRLIAQCKDACRSAKGNWSSLGGLVDKYMAVREAEFEPILLPWAGGSVMGAASSWEDAITREAYLRDRLLPEPLFHRQPQ